MAPSLDIEKNSLSEANPNESDASASTFEQPREGEKTDEDVPQQELALDPLVRENATKTVPHWADDPQNPYNWSTRRKAMQVVMISSLAFATSLGTSVMAPSHSQLMEEFGVDSTAAIASVSLYVFALALGPVIGGPLSETIGRYLVFVIGAVLGCLFTLGAGFTHSFAALCVLRFLAGFFLGPNLAVSAGVINEIYKPVDRGLPSTFFILSPFLGPGLAPVIGAFVTNRMGWRWTQWTIIFFLIQSLIVALVWGRETYHPVLERRRAKQLNLPLPETTPLSKRVEQFLTIAVLRPLHMLVTEPIVGFICLYVACEFATLFSFFAAVPFVFGTVYHFTLEQSGLVFLSIVVGCVLGSITVLLCDRLYYRPRVARFAPANVPPEYRLLPALIGSVGLPIGLFWFGWTARADVHWASPVVAIVPFAWGNLCLFISTIQYMVDTYSGLTIASASSANSFARYVFAGAFPLFTIQMYSRLGTDWASSLLAFIAVLLLPVPWVLFKYGKKIRALSKYPTVSF